MFHKRINKAGNGKHSLFLSSMSRRFTFMLLIVAFFCMMMIAVVAVKAMNSVERNRISASMMNDVQQMSDVMSQEYLTLVHISQQMVPYGYIGQAVEEYIKAETPYDRITATKMVSTNLNLAIFSTPLIELAQYYTAVDETMYEPGFSNMVSKDGFDPLSLETAYQTWDVSFQGLHQTGNRYNNSQVISIIRTVSFSDEIERYIYIESRTNVISNLAETANAQGIPYSLIQLNEDGMVLYSELAEFPAGSAFPDSGNLPNALGRTDGFVWCAADALYGNRIVLLLPEDYYDREANQMIREIFIAAAFAAAIILVVAYTFRGTFYRPIKTLEQEMDRFAKGQRQDESYHFGIQEYDSLFERFSQMKNDIIKLMDDIYVKECEKRQLELDKLYFQINPHFLMNALNSARWQAVMGHQTELASYLTNLNFLLGYTLGKVNSHTTLRSELKLLEAYLQLQQSRQDFQVHYDVEEGIYLDRPCARLILQPIAENAICHSINEFGNIWIHIKPAARQSVEILIRDDGHGFEAGTLSFKEPGRDGGERQTKNGIGLRYVWLSIEQFYDGRAEMEVNSSPGQGTEVRLCLPY